MDGCGACKVAALAAPATARRKQLSPHCLHNDPRPRSCRSALAAGQLNGSAGGTEFRERGFGVQGSVAMSFQFPVSSAQSPIARPLQVWAAKAMQNSSGGRAVWGDRSAERSKRIYRSEPLSGLTTETRAFMKRAISSALLFEWVCASTESENLPSLHLSTSFS